MIDYSRFDLTRRQQALAISIGCAACFAGAWLIFRQPVVALAAAPFGLLYPRLRRESLRKRRKERLRLQFKEMLQGLTSLLSAGRSVENAFHALEADLMPVIGDMRSDLLRELRMIANRMKNGEPLEILLTDFAARSDLEEVRHFAEAFSICKRAGGDMVEIVRRTSQLIGEKMEVEMEVSVLMSQKKFESRIMMGMPFAFIGFLESFAAEYMAPLHQGVGWVLLAACLLLLAGCCWWMLRIMDIEV